MDLKRNVSKLVGWWGVCLLVCVLAARAQSTAVTLQVTDTDGQQWWDGSYSIQLYDPNALQQGPWFIKGTSTQVNSNQAGALNGTGGASFTVTTNSVIVPSGSIWQINACAFASAYCYRTTFTAVGSTQTLTLAPPPPVVNLSNMSVFNKAYLPDEITNAIVGSVYYNLNTECSNVCTDLPCSSNWHSMCGEVATACPNGQVMTGENSAGNAICVPFPTPTTGNCPGGQFMTGIDGTVDCGTPPAGGTPSAPQYSVQYNDPLGTFAGSSKFVTNASGFVGINGGGTLEIDSISDPANNFQFTDGMNFYAYNNGANILGSFEFFYDDSGKPPGVTSLTVTNVEVTSNVLIVTTSTNPASLQGHPIIFTGLTTATFLNNLILYAAYTTVSTVTCTYTHADYPSAADTGTVRAQLPANISDLFPNVDIFKPLGTGTGVDAVIESDVTAPFVANILRGYRVERGGSGSTAHAYGLDVEDFSLWADTVESAQVRTQYHGGTPTPHDYAIKVEADATGTPAVYAYPTGDLYARNSFQQVTGITIESCVQTVGIGLSDCTVTAVAAGSGPPQTETINFEICTTGTFDTFDYSPDGVPTCATPTAMAGGGNSIGTGLKVTWGATTGHTAGDRWTNLITVGTLNVGAAAATRTAKVTILAPVSGDDGLTLVLNEAVPVHLKRISCGVQGTTSVVVNLVKGGDSLIVDSTCTAGDANTVITTTWANGSGQCGGTSDCAVAAHAPVTLHIGTVTDSPTALQLSVDYMVD